MEVNYYKNIVILYILILLFQINRLLHVFFLKSFANTNFKISLFPHIKTYSPALTSKTLQSNMFFHKHPTFSPKLKMQQNEIKSFFNERQVKQNTLPLLKTTYVCRYLVKLGNKLHIRYIITLNAMPFANRERGLSKEWKSHITRHVRTK